MIIIGGGIGGLCLAQGLVKAGVEAVVCERDTGRAGRADRYRLHISPAGGRALRACLPGSAWQRFLDGAGEASGGFGFLTERLRTLVVVEESVMYPPSADPAERAHPADRMFLREILLSGLDGTVEFGRDFDRYDLLPGGGVRARFADGSETAGDILVGADGAGSAVRRQYLPAAEPVPAGATGIGWTVPLAGGAGPRIPGRLGHGMNMIMVSAPFFLFTSAFRRPPGPGGAAGAPGGDYLLCALVTRSGACPPGVGSFTGPELRAVAATMMAGWHPDLVRLAAEAAPETFGAFPFAAAPAVPAWPGSQVTVLGDAIHCMPPAGGIGANMALRDASLLARNLAAAARGEVPLAEAVSGYEAEMRDYAFGAVRSALGNLRAGTSASLPAQAGMRAWFRLCGAVPALRRSGFGESWNRDARPRPWELAA
ncbi:MAG: FAD-dependent monooxygenase [Nocardiopsaceae bacterium]|nr:FAD-dependent monooxygenase [Nocardiopsaceae bacterium]